MKMSDERKNIYNATPTKKKKKCQNYYVMWIDYTYSPFFKWMLRNVGLLW